MKNINVIRSVADTERKDGAIFDLKSWVTDGTKIRSGIPSNWWIFESNWLDIESQFELTRNPGSNFSYACDSTF